MYKTADDVFFRKYGDSTVVYKTGIKKVFVMNAVCFSILDFFREPHTFEECINHLAEQFHVEMSDDFSGGLLSFFAELESNGILSEQYRLHEENASLEESIVHGGIIPPKTLQRVMFELTYRCNERCRHCYCVGCELHTELTRVTWNEDPAPDNEAAGVKNVVFARHTGFPRMPCMPIVSQWMQKMM